MHASGNGVLRSCHTATEVKCMYIYNLKNVFVFCSGPHHDSVLYVRKKFLHEIFFDYLDCQIEAFLLNDQIFRTK